MALAHRLADLAPGWGLVGWQLGAILFVVGWFFQFVGHYWEGRKPAFVDDIVGLLVGPMFVVAEALFAAGWGRDLAAAITRGAGPVRQGRAGTPALRKYFWASTSEATWLQPSGTSTASLWNTTLPSRSALSDTNRITRSGSPGR